MCPVRFCEEGIVPSFLMERVKARTAVFVGVGFFFLSLRTFGEKSRYSN